MRLVNNILKLINTNNERRALAENMSYLFILKISGYIFPLITIPYLAKTIGVEGYGKIAFATAIVAWFQTICDWGFTYTATRDVAQNKNDLKKVSIIFSQVLWSRLLLMLISFTILYSITTYIGYLHDKQNIILLTFLVIPGRILFPDWLFQALEKMKFITFFDLISKLIFTLLVFVFIKEKSDYILYPLFIALGYIFTGLVSMYIVIFRWNITLQKPILMSTVHSLVKSFDVFINLLMPHFNLDLSSILLNIYGGNIANGIFSAGNRFSVVAQQLMMVISRAFFPLLSRKMHLHNQYLKINLSLALLLSASLFIFSPIIIDLFFTSEFKESILILRILAISIFFQEITSSYGTNYLIINKFEKSLRNITFVSTLFGILLAIPLIYHYEAVGAALAIAISRFFSAILVATKAKAIKKSIVIRNSVKSI